MKRKSFNAFKNTIAVVATIHAVVLILIVLKTWEIRRLNMISILDLNSLFGGSLQYDILSAVLSFLFVVAILVIFYRREKES